MTSFLMGTSCHVLSVLNNAVNTQNSQIIPIFTLHQVLVSSTRHIFANDMYNHSISLRSRSLKLILHRKKISFYIKIST